MENYNEGLAWQYMQGKIFRVSKLKEMFTPLEQSEKYDDETIYDELYEYAKLEVVLPLPVMKDYWLGFRGIYIDIDIVNKEYVYKEQQYNNIEYVLLSKVRLLDVSEQWEIEKSCLNEVEESEEEEE